MTENQRDENDMQQERFWRELREGDRNALGKLFTGQFEMLYNYGYRIVPEPELVRDAIQELFYRLWNTRERLPEVQSVRAYLLVSLRRELLSEKGARKRREEVNESFGTEGFNDSFINYDKWVEILELDERNRRELKKAIRSLTPRQREAVYLKYYEGLSTPEICKVMDLQAQSVYNFLAKALQSLRSFLDR